MLRLSIVALLVFVGPGVTSGRQASVADETTVDRDQKKIDLRPKRIGREGNGTFTLVEALELVGRDTGNPVRRDPDCEAKDETRDLKLRKRTFWEAVSIISEEWDVPVSELTTTVRSVTLEEWKRAGWNQPPVPSAAREVAALVDGIFRLRVFESNESPRRTHLVLEGEPRLVSLALTWTHVTLTGESPESVAASGSPTAGVRNVVVLNSTGLELGNKTNLRLDLKAIYFYDWRTTKLGKLSSLDNTQETTAGAAAIRIGPRQDQDPLTLRAKWTTRLFVEPELVIVDRKTKGQHAPDTVSYSNVRGWQISFPTVSADTALRDLEVELRSPRRAKKLEWSVDLSLPVSK